MFDKELKYIKNPKYRENALKLLDILPDYFFKVPASSTGKYHPKFALGEKGLVRHTKAAMTLAYDLLYNNHSVFNSFSDNEKDLLIIGIMVHDGLKLGLPEEKYTRFDHPILICNHIKENIDKLGFSDKEIEFICEAIKTHMGEWTTDYNGNEVLERPSTNAQRFVHMCDYLASRKYLEFNFTGDNIDGI